MSTEKYKLLNGILVEMTQQEIDEQTKPESEKLQLELQTLRTKRNVLLLESDWIELNNVPLTSAKKTEWQTYRTNLRDITNGLTTVEEVNAVVFPTKPSE